jgi:hypothetical protein
MEKTTWAAFNCGFFKDAVSGPNICRMIYYGLSWVWGCV